MYSIGFAVRALKFVLRGWLSNTFLNRLLLDFRLDLVLKVTQKLKALNSQIDRTPVPLDLPNNWRLQIPKHYNHQN